MSADDLLERALADLAEHPDSSAKEIGKRIGANDRAVFAVLDKAAYGGWCQSGSRWWSAAVSPAPHSALCSRPQWRRGTGGTGDGVPGGDCGRIGPADEYRLVDADSAVEARLVARRR